MNSMLKAYNINPQITSAIQLNFSFGLSKAGPWKDSETEIDCGGIEQVDFATKLKSVPRGEGSASGKELVELIPV
jgi:hypothetical protein